MIEIEHLDLNVCRHCNMRCVSCSHASPFADAWSMPLDMIERDLFALKPILKPKNVTVVGGEPTLHKELAEILRLLKRIRIDEQSMVITNGKLLPRMKEEFWQELEILKISIYANFQESTLTLAKEKAGKYRFHLDVQEFPEFFQQFDAVPDGSSFHNCPWKTDCYTVHNGFFFLCPQSAFFPSSIMGIQENIDGLPLEGITETRLREFMDRTTPLNACRTCRAYGHPKPWKEAKTKSEWLAESTI